MSLTRRLSKILRENLLLNSSKADEHSALEEHVNVEVNRNFGRVFFDLHLEVLCYKTTKWFFFFFCFAG